MTLSKPNGMCSPNKWSVFFYAIIIVVSVSALHQHRHQIKCSLWWEGKVATQTLQANIQPGNDMIWFTWQLHWKYLCFNISCDLWQTLHMNIHPGNDVIWSAWQLLILIWLALQSRWHIILQTFLFEHFAWHHKLSRWIVNLGIM